MYQFRYIAALLIMLRPGCLLGQTLKWDEENSISKQESVYENDMLLLKGTADWTNADDNVGKLVVIQKKSPGKTEETYCKVNLAKCEGRTEVCYCEHVQGNIYNIILNITATRGVSEAEFQMLATHENNKDHVQSQTVKLPRVYDQAISGHAKKTDLDQLNNGQCCSQVEALRKALIITVCIIAPTLLFTVITVVGICIKIRSDKRELLKKLDNLEKDKTKTYVDDPSPIQELNTRDRKSRIVKAMEKVELENRMAVRQS